MDTLWPHGQYKLKHTDHVDRIDWHIIPWDTLTTWTIYTETYWPCRQHRWIHSDYMGSIWDTHWPHGHYVGYTLTTWAPYGETLWPHGHYMTRHSGIMWDTLWPRGQYILKHTDHVDRIDWHIIPWDTLTTWALRGTHSDHVDNIYWNILTM